MERFPFDLQRFADLIEGTDGDDNLTGAGDSMIVDAKAGNDAVNFVGDNNTIDGGADNDNINVTGDGNSITGGADDDTINVKGNKNTISGTGGNDYIDNYNYDLDDVNHGTVYVYGGGNDTISNFEADNFLLIEGYSWETLRGTDDDGNETGQIIVNVLDGSSTVGTITL